MNFGTVSLAAPQAASSRVSRYSRTDRRVLAMASQSTSSDPAAERCLLASAAIRLASTAKAAPSTSPSAMQRLQIQLLRGLGRYELHRRALHGFGNRFGIIEVVLLSLAIGADIFGWHQPGIVTKRCEFAAQVMCADAGFHADQARRYIGEPRFDLATRPLLPQHDGAARIVA